jgi:Family of unknown function (DUF5681)
MDEPMSDSPQTTASANNGRSVGGLSNLRPWQKGQSGNPNGRPKGDVQALARQHTEAAIQALVDCLDDPKLKVQAAIALLDRGWGRPAVEIVTPDDANSITFQHLVAARAFSDELLRERVAADAAGAPTISGRGEPVTLADLMKPAIE